MNNDDKIQIYVSTIPEYIKGDLTAATLEFIRYIKRKHPKKFKEYVDALSENNK